MMAHSENAMKAKKSVKKFNGRLITVEFAKRKQENKLMDDMAESRNDKEDSDDEDDYEMQTSQQQQQQQQQKKTKASELIIHVHVYFITSRSKPYCL